MGSERHDVAFVVGAVLGGLIAAGVTLFRAPQPGAQTRAQIAERLEPVTSKTTELSRTVTDQTRTVTSQSVAKSKELTASVKGMVGSEDQPPTVQPEELVVVEPLGTSDLEPLPAVNAVPPVPADEVAAARDNPETTAEPPGTVR